MTIFAIFIWDPGKAGAAEYFMNVNVLKQKLNSISLEERIWGIKDAIAESEVLAVYVIKEYLPKEKDETVISAMLIACAKIGGEDEIEYIASHLNHESFKVRRYALQSIWMVDSPAKYPHVFRIVIDGEPRLKQIAVKIIKGVGKQKCFEILENMIVSETEWHRKIALSVLDMLNNAIYENEIVDVLVKSIGHSKPENRAEGVGKLKKIAGNGSEYAATALEKLRKDGALSQKEKDDVEKLVADIISGDLAVEQAQETIQSSEACQEGVTTAEPHSGDAPKASGAAQAPAVTTGSEKVIAEFSEYVDSVKSRKLKTASQKTLPPAEKRGSIAMGAAAGFIRKIGGLFRNTGYFLLIWPAKLAYRFRYQCAALFFMALCCYIYIFPELVLGKGTYSDVSREDGEKISKHLAARGYLLAPRANGSLPLFYHDFWVNFSGATDGIVGKSIVFSAYEVNLKNVEIFEGVAYLRGGLVTGVKNIRNLTQTPDADEMELVPLKNSFAYLAHAAGGVKIFTIEDGDFSNRRQFLFKQPVDISKIENSALAFNLVKIETKNGQGRSNVSLNVDSGCVDPPDFPVEYIPNSQAEDPLIPRIVERVRSLNFVGPEKIAKLEDAYYQSVDFFKRTVSGGEEEYEGRSDADAPSKPAENQEGQAEQAPADARPGSEEKQAVKTEQAAPAEGQKAVKAFRTPLLTIMTDAASHNVVAAGPVAKGETAVRTAFFADAKTVFAAAARARALSVSSLTGPDGEPARVLSIFKKSSLESEGVWLTDDLPALNGRNFVYKTRYRVDLKRPFAVLNVLSMDVSMIDLHFVTGTEEPVSSIGLRGKGVIPDDPETYQNLICAFNGGFRTKHGKWGAIASGVTYIPPDNGVATIAVDSKGKISIGTWGTSISTTENYVYLRQNLPPLVEKGKINETNKYWGFSVDNKTQIWRSALGITRDGRRLIYAAGNSLSYDTLAKGMIMAGCDYAMQLDVNDYHTYCIICRLATDKKGTQKMKSRRLADEMTGENGRYIKPYTRDFFYVTWKKSLVQTAQNLSK